MILLDTHIWIWWINNSPDLSQHKSKVIAVNISTGLAVSAISCWEIAKLVEKGRLAFSVPVKDWIDRALSAPGIVLVPLEPSIAIASTQLPPPIHNDPADQIIAATARELDIPLATDDRLLSAYPHLRLVW